MGREKVEEMKKVHDRILAETELKLERALKEKEVALEQARLEGRQE